MAGSSSNYTHEILQNIYRGIFTVLPPKLPNIVKIFLSSTTKDYRVERDDIIRNAYMNLREYCREHYGFDLTMIDLRWGIRRELGFLNITTQFCLNEVRRCLNESVGPAFIAFLSHRYGSRMLREAVEKNEFEDILKYSEPVEYNGINLMNHCYELDENDIGEVKLYKLKAQKDILKGFPDEFKKIWKEKESLILDRMRSTAKQIFPENQSRKFFVSVTEEEIINGILNNDQANEMSLAFFRKIITNTAEIDEMRKKGYVDASAEEIEFLEELKENVESKLDNKNQYNLEINWNETDGMSEGKEETKAYLKQFTDAFTKNVINMIEKRIARLTASNNYIKLSDYDNEIIHHASLCNHLQQNFIEKSDYISQLKNYVADPSNNKPFFIYGPSGSGKSSIMANLVQNFTQRNFIVAIRLMGTSRLSSNIYSIYLTLIYQFSKLFNLNNVETKFKDEYEARDYLYNKVLSSENDHNNCKIIILLDSIDQLNENDYNNNNLSWINYKLPSNVKVIYSVLDKHANILERIKRKIEFKKRNYLEICDMNYESGMKQLKQRLNNRSRDLQVLQWNLISDCLKRTAKIYPLHIKLLFDICVKWRSTYLPSNENDSIECCTTMNETINYLFKKYEAYYGPIVFSRCIFYLTVFKNGISESELEDILSIDDDVLNEIFDKYEPPIRRFPNSIWLRIKNEINDYLTEKESDDTLVISWFHRSFNEASQNHYTQLFTPSDTRDKLLQNIIDYFLEKWSKNPKKYDFNGVKKQAIRFTKQQKLKYISKKTNQLIYNKRKLNEFLNIILMLNNVELKIQYLLEYIYLSYPFMHCKATLNNLEFLIQTHDYIENLLKKSSNNKISQLFEISSIYNDNYAQLIAYPDSIINEILSKISNNRSLIEIFKSSLSELSNQFTLVPLQNSYEDAISIEKTLFIPDRTITNVDIYWCYNLPYILIKYVLNETISKFKLINHKNAKEINGELEIKYQVKNEGYHDIYKPIFLSYTNPILCMNDIDGGIAYKHENDIYLKTFSNMIYTLKKSDQPIHDILLLSAHSLIIRYERSFEIIDFREPKLNTIKSEVQSFNDQIYDIKVTTCDKQSVYMNDYELIDYTIIAILFESKINVYKFNKLTRKIEKNHEIEILFDYKICYSRVSAYNAEYTNKYVNCMMDRFNLGELINNNQFKYNTEVMQLLTFNGKQSENESRFRIDNELKLTATTILLDSSCLKYKTTDLTSQKRILFNDSNDDSKFFDFYNNRFIYSLIDNHNEILETNIYDLKQLAIVKSFEESFVLNSWWDIQFVDKKRLFCTRVAFPFGKCCVYDLMSSNETERMLNDFDRENGKIIDDRLVYKASSSCIVKTLQINDTKIETEKNQRNKLLFVGDTGALYDFIDDENILIKIEDEGFSVLNVSIQKVVNLLVNTEGYEFISFDKKVLILWDKQKKFKFYKVKYLANNTFESFIEIEMDNESNTPFDFIPFNNGNKWDFVHSVKCFKQYILTAYNNDSNSFEIAEFKLIKREDSSFYLKLNQKTSVKTSLNLFSEFSMMKTMPLYCLTSQSNNLVYASFLSKLNQGASYEFEINCVNLLSSSKAQVDPTEPIKLEFKTLELSIHNIMNDDIIVHSRSDTSLKLLKSSEKFNFKYEKIELSQGLAQTILYNNKYLCCLFDWPNYNIKIFDVADMSNVFKFIESPSPNSISFTSKYLFIPEYLPPKRIRVFEYENNINEIFKFPLKYKNVMRICTSEKFIAVKLESNDVVSYFINDLKNF